MVSSKSEPGSISEDAAESEDTGIETLYRRYGHAIRRHIEWHFGFGPPDPEDAVHAAFERFAGISDKTSIKDPAAFLRRSARNFALDHYRAAKTRQNHASLEQSVGDRVDELDAERVLSAKERLTILRSAIGEMDERRRDILIMHRIDGLNCAEIGRRLACSPTLVKLRLAEAITICERALRSADGDL